MIDMPLAQFDPKVPSLKILLFIAAASSTGRLTIVS
ncbi:hypothetical protein FHR22_002099 [Sphingopyxis panaciterrae]|nr:hypothetical protein [Sphingopyxis panaciterrae]